ncbi:serine protease [Pelagibius sp. 7325]|uniref:S1 family peptidase n=1 Tax=Pelagibius sp. 7325 TaxID=3131994 RepID=UPI0030EF0EFF
MIGALSRGLAVAALCCLCAPTVSAKPSAETVRKAAASVVRVMADGCPGAQGARVGSGFVWAEAGQVVTALHVVADCTSITVEYVDTGVQRRATPERFLRTADLALLSVADPPAVPILSQMAKASEQEDLAAIGMPLNVKTWQEAYGERALNVRKLDDILNDGARQQIRNLGAPSIELEIFRLTAVVKPGSSGGPVINAQGHVVGIVDGGLDGGNASLNWAVPAGFLQHLMESGEPGNAAGLGPAAETVFAFSVPAGDQQAEAVNESLFCGGRSYFHLATRDLNQIVDSLSQPGTLDDPASFIALVAIYSQHVPLDDLAAIRFDLWVDGETGATIAVPETMPLRDEAGFCIAESQVSDVGLIFTGGVFNPNQVDVQMVSTQFEGAVVQLLGLSYCQPDPAAMEPYPHTRFDGLIARRSGTYCVNGYTGAQLYGIIGHLARLNSYAGVVAINAAQYANGAYLDPQQTLDWAAAALAVLISTYQI